MFGGLESALICALECIRCILWAARRCRAAGFWIPISFLQHKRHANRSKRCLRIFCALAACVFPVWSPSGWHVVPRAYLCAFDATSVPNVARHVFYRCSVCHHLRSQSHGFTWHLFARHLSPTSSPGNNDIIVLTGQQELAAGQMTAVMLPERESCRVLLSVCDGHV